MKSAFAWQRLRNGKYSRWLAVLGLSLWLISLVQPSLVFYAGEADRAPRGAEILVGGWLAIVGLITPAWIANFTLLVTIIILITTDKETATTIAICSVLLALDTFRVTQFHGKGSGEHIYGYGMGVVFWFTAILVVLAAASIRNCERAHEKVSPYRLPQLPLTIATTLALSIFLIFSMTWHWNDRRGASKTEQEYLASAVFKRGMVCKETVLPPRSTLNLDGPLEIIGNGSPLDSVHRYLSWGIPTVRRGEWDYFLSDRNNINTVAMRFASGPPSATLKIEEKEWPSSKHYLRELRATLTASNSSQVSFEQSWFRGGRTGPHYCPDLFLDNALPEDPPRSMLLQTLRSPTPITQPNDVGTRPLYHGFRWPPGTAILVETTTESATHPIEASPGCGTEIQLLPRRSAPAGGNTMEFDYGFRIADTFHLFSFTHELKVACSGTAAFLIHASGSNDPKAGLLISVEKKSLPDFRAQWTTRVAAPYFHKTWQDGGKSTIAIKSLQDNGNDIVLELINNQTRELLKISFDVPKQTSHVK